MTQEYFVTFDGKEHRVFIENTKNNNFLITVSEKKFLIDIEKLDESTLFMIFDSQVFTIQKEEISPNSKSEFSIHINEKHFTVSALTEREKTFTRFNKEKKHDAGKIIYAPMPGKVVKILVQLGQEVQPGDGLIIIEAMKMENEIKSQTRGKIAKIHTSEQKSVENQAILIEIEP